MLAVASITLICIPNSDAKRKKVRVPGGTTIPGAGIVIDASYDPRLDTLVEGYKVINVALDNRSFNIIYFSPEKDAWSVKLAGRRKPVKAIYNLRNQDPKAWASLPEGARNIVGYPLVLPIGGREVFDIFVPDTFDLQKFNELRVYIKSMNSRFDVLVSQ